MARWDRITEKAHALRPAALQGDQGRPRPLRRRRRRRSNPSGKKKSLAPIRREGLPEPGAGHDLHRPTASSSRRLMDYILELEHQNPGRKIAVLLPGAGRTPLVGERPPQPARPASEAPPPPQRKPANRRSQHPLVPVSIRSRFLPPKAERHPADRSSHIADGLRSGKPLPSRTRPLQFVCRPSLLVCRIVASCLSVLGPPQKPSSRPKAALLPPQWRDPCPSLPSSPVPAQRLARVNSLRTFVPPNILSKIACQAPKPSKSNKTKEIRIA